MIGSLDLAWTRLRSVGFWGLITFLLGCAQPRAGSEITRPYLGVTYIVRTETVPRPVIMHILLIDLTAPGIRFKVTPPAGTRDTLRQTTLGFLNQENAQAAMNAHFYLPYTTPEPDANVVGLAASEGKVYSPFEDQPIAAGFPNQSYAILPFAPALNIDAANHATIVHRDAAFADNRHVLEPVTLWNVVAGSAQIVSNSIKTLPTYSGAPGGLTPLNGYSDTLSWYTYNRARTAIGMSADGRTLVWFTVDQSAQSYGMSVSEVADLLIRDYQVANAINLDGGPSTTLALRDPVTGLGSVVNASGDTGFGGGLGSNLALFAQPAPRTEPPLQAKRGPRRTLILSWPAPPETWLLEQSADLALTVWQRVETTPNARLVGDRLELELEPNAETRWFRLSR